MTAILNMSALVNLASKGGTNNPQQVNFKKWPFIVGLTPGTLVAGSIIDLWQWDGMPGGAGSSAPTTSTAMTNATAGAWGQTTPTSGADLFLCSVNVTSLQAGSVIIYDRLNQSGGMSAIVTSAQTTNLPTAGLTRYTNGVGVEAWAEIYTAIGTTATTVKCSYTNTVPTSGQTSQLTTFGSAGFDGAQTVIPMPLAVGDNGVQAVASVTVTASTLTAGNFGVTLVYPLVVLPVPLIGVGFVWSGIASSGGPLDLGTLANSCLSIAWVGNSATAPYLYGSANFVSN